MRVALVHDWLTGMRGGEKCLEVFCELFPDANLYTLLHVTNSVSPLIEKHQICTSFIQKLPLSQRVYRYYLPFFPWAIQSFDLSGYDLVISLNHCVAKGVQIPSGVCHISYIFTPMRYIWDQYDGYFNQNYTDWSARLGMAMIRGYLQRWDIKTSENPDYLMTISDHVANRIKRFYHREATVIYPPVDWEASEVSNQDDGFYLMVTAFAPYKRVDLAIHAANQLKLPLKIIGNGQGEKYLRKIAGSSVEFLGWRPDKEVREAYSKCRALIFPGEEDFGIVPVEAMAYGKPVIAYGKGGVLESVIPIQGGNEGMPTGLFFFEQSSEALVKAILQFEKSRGEFHPKQIRDHVKKFDRNLYKDKINDFVTSSFHKFKQSHSGN